VFAPITQAGWNPARDFGPRLVALLAGYGEIAIPGPQSGFWIYIVGPLIGGPIGGLLYERGLRSHMPPKVPSGVESA
jgi:glycerol uptake facilitator protein